MARPTGDALREALEVIANCDGLRRVFLAELTALPNGKEKDDAHRWFQSGSAETFKEVAQFAKAALASQPVETKGPWIARLDNDIAFSEGWWVHCQLNRRPKRWYGPFTEPQARGVARELNRLEPK